MTWHVDVAYETYETAREQFEWGLPDDYNLAHDLLRKHDDTDALALRRHYPDDQPDDYSFADLDRLSGRVANALANRGIAEGDRIGVVLSQTVANPVTHLACWKLGAVSLPLSVLFGTDGLQSRLHDSEAVAVVTTTEIRDAATEAVRACPNLEYHFEAGDGAGESDATEPFEALLEAPPTFDRVETTADTPAIIMYTSGSTGPPKGVLQGHGVWVGHCAAFQMYFELDVAGTFWTPADWAWIGALGDLLFPAWHYGQPVVGYPMGGFDTEQAYDIMEQYDVTNTFLPPTAIRMMMNETPSEWDLSVEAICSGGEPLTPEILEWVDEELGGVPVNELYGQTEANLLATNCQQWFDAQPASMGKPVPGHEVAPIDPETGERKPDDEVGQLAVKRDGPDGSGDPVVFQQYWNLPDKTASASVDAMGQGTWHLTGDLASRDSDGYLWFKSRDDDVIITAGYRVGPGEVESAILEHPAVEQVGVIGVDDDLRNEVIKAFVQPVAPRRNPVTDSEILREEIQDLVRTTLAKHEYPREIEFVDDLPQTTTSKIQRRKLRNREA